MIKQREREKVAPGRMARQREWLDRLTQLVTTVRGWAEELEWATRAVTKEMEDAEIGDYSAPALLLQQDATRLFLEPIAREAPGTEGVVDLYLMPSYDDIASLYYHHRRWNIQYVFQKTSAAPASREGEAKPLTKAAFRKVLDQMKAHAGRSF